MIASTVCSGVTVAYIEGHRRCLLKHGLKGNSAGSCFASKHIIDALTFNEREQDGVDADAARASLDRRRLRQPDHRPF